MATPKMNLEPISAPYQTFPTDGHRMKYRTLGDPTHPAFVMVHGWLGTSETWRTITDLFAETHFCILVDLLGHAASDKPRGVDYGIEAQGRRVLALVDYLGIDRFALMGHSMGGMIVLMIASVLAPERVTHLINVSGVMSGEIGPEADANRAKTQLMMRFPFLVTGLRAAMRVPALAQAQFKPWFYTFPPFDVWRPEREATFLPGVGNVGYAAQIAIETTDLTPHLSRITAPTLTIFGRQDQVIPPSEGEAVERGVAHSQIVWLNNVSHFPMYEAPDAFREAVTTFMGVSQATARHT